MNLRYVLPMFLIVPAVAIATACSSAPAQVAPTALPATHKFDVHNFVGTYKGTWTNTTAGTSGPVTIAIAADESSKTATLTIDFDGNYLGLGDPPAQTLSAKYDDSAATIKGSNPLFGDYAVSLDGDGKLNGLMKNLAAGVIPEMTYTGTVGNGRLDADYVVKFADGRVVNSILRMQRQ